MDALSWFLSSVALLGLVIVAFGVLIAWLLTVAVKVR